MSWPIVQVSAASLMAGLAAGWLMHRADFCSVAALRDRFLFRDTSMLRAQLLLVAVSGVFFALLERTGLLAYPGSTFFGPPSFANLIGGALFGFGMVLAGGCVVGVLYRLGSGSRLALVALVGLLCGSAAYAELHTWWLPLAQTMRLADLVTLPQLTGTPPAPWVAGMAFLAAWLWRGFVVERRQSGRVVLRGYLAPHHAALGLASCGVGSLLLVGMPLGVTTSYAKIVAGVEQLVSPRHVASLDFFSRQPLDYTPPFSSLALVGGAGPRLDAVALIQYPLVVGIILGAAYSSYRLEEFRGRFSPPRLQVATAFAGGAIMGLGSRLTPGCNVWHIWGGLPVMAASSLLFLAGLLPGAWLGTRLVSRIVLSSQQGGA